jgi:magnesium transporter
MARVFRAWEVTADSIDDIEEPATISDCLARDSLVWVDLVEPSEKELELLAGEFDLHPLWIRDVKERNRRPKLEIFETHAFLIGYAHDEDPTDLPEVALFIAEHWLISVRKRNEAGRVFEIDKAREFYERIRNHSNDVGLLLYALLDDMVDGYFDTVDAAEEQIADIEQALFDEVMDDQKQIQQDLLHVRRALIEMRRHVAPMRDVVLAVLRREIPWVEGDPLVYLQDVLDRLLRILDGVDAQRELLGNVVDAQLGLQANRMNSVMKKMTSWGAILICATLIAGIYGMNFRNMPELGWRFGYPGALGSMLVVTGGLYLWFRHKDWL